VPLSPDPSTAPLQAVVVGGGLAGLAAAEQLLADGFGQVVVVEPADRCGGVLGTARRDGWLVERSADCFLAARPEGMELVDRLGLERDLVGVDPRVRRALVWHDGRAVPVPRGFRLLAPGRIDSILSSSLFSPAGRLRLLAERTVPVRRDGEEESLEQFAVRRLGREAFERLVQPLAAGIWTADPARLGMAAACREFAEMEQTHGSLWAGERARLKNAAEEAGTGARYGQFVTFANGMQTLPDRLAEAVFGRGAIWLKGRAERLARHDGRWRLTFTDREDRVEAVDADAIVLATPAPAAAVLLAGVDPRLAADLAGIAYAGSVIVSLGFRREAVTHPLDAAGLVVPRIAGRRVLAVSFSSSKFPDRAPPGCVLLRVFVGGALDPEAVGLDDAAVASLAHREVGDLLGISEDPLLVQIDRWDAAMPQYHIGHAERVGRIETAVSQHSGLALAGAAYRGVGIPQVIGSGRHAAEAVLATVGAARAQ
jgi:oxygen-dependent protoporphyrinogen oxidase